MAFDFGTLAALAAIIVFAYTVFGLTGFGAGITAMPLLAQAIPLHMAVPLMLLYDLTASVLLGLRNRQAIERREVLRILPFLAGGMGLGVLALVRAPERILLLVLGAALLCYASWSLLRRGAPRPLGAAWVVLFGTAGGFFTATFGVGGPFYTIYLTRRLQDKLVLRATIGGVLFISALGRLALFSGAGLYRQDGLLPLAALLLPFALLGLYLGNRLHRRLPAERVVQAIWLVLIAGGASLVLRNL